MKLIVLLKQYLPVNFCNGSIIFGEILCLLFVEEVLWFVLRKYYSEPHEHFGSLQLKSINQYICIQHCELLDPFPLSLYILDVQGKKINLLSLKHHLCENN